MMQYVIHDINPNSNFMDNFGVQNTLLSSSGNYSSGTFNSLNDSLPTAQRSISPTTDISYTDIVSTSLNWLLTQSPAKPVFDLILMPRTIGIYLFPSNIYFSSLIAGVFYITITFLLVSWALSKV